MAINRQDLGQRPRSVVLHKALTQLVDFPFTAEVIVHHYTDTPKGLQLEVEFRIYAFSENILGGKVCIFKRIFV